MTLAFQSKDSGRPRHDIDTELIAFWIHVESTPFTGRAWARCRRSELRSLRSCFIHLLNGSGDDLKESFSLGSGELSLSIHLTHLGHPAREIGVNAHPPGGPLVRIPICADRIYLPLWIKAIDSALDAA